VTAFRDGNVLVSGDGDGKLRLNKSGAGGVHEIDAHEGGVMHVALSPDERLILTTGCDNLAKLWNSQTGELVRTFTGHTGWVTGAAFVGDGSRIVTVSFDGHIKLWDAATAEVVKSLHVPEMAHCVTASPDWPLIAAGLRDGSVRLYRADDLLETARLTGHTDRVRVVVFTTDGRHVISGSYDRTMRVWSVKSARQVAKVEHAKHIFNTLAVAPGGQYVFSAGGIWKPNEETNDWEPEQDYAIRMWRLPISVSVPAAPPPTGAVAEVKHVAQLEGHGSPVFGLAVTADGQTALSTSDDQYTRVWDLANRKQVRELKSDAAMRCVAVTADGSLAAWSGGQKSISLWDLASDKPLPALGGHTNWVYSLQFTKDKSKLLSISRDGKVHLWDLATGQPTLTLETINRQDIVAKLSPDETKILASSDNFYTLTLWNVADGQPLAKLHGHGVEGVYAAAFSPDGSQIATADGKGAIHLRSGGSGEPRVTWLGHKGRVTALAFALNGRHLVSGGFDGMLHVWDAQSGQLVARGTTGKPVTNQLAVLPNGKQVLTAGGWTMNERDEFQQPGDFAVHVWDLPQVEP
jgi:WD40 repeat protein